MRERPEPLAEPLEGCAAVLQLTPPLRRRHGDPRRGVHEPDAALGLVAVLAARPAADEEALIALGEQRVVGERERASRGGADVLRHDRGHEALRPGRSATIRSSERMMDIGTPARGGW